MISGRGLRAGVALALLAALAACSGPRLSAGITVGPNGIGITPVLSGDVGGLTVGVAPGTIRDGD